MSNVFFLCFSFVMGLSIVGCTERKGDVNSANVLRIATLEKGLPSKADMDAKFIQPNSKTVDRPKKRFDASLISAVHELIGKEISDGITTWNDSNNASETQFPDGSKIRYVAGGLRQYIDENGKVTSYNSNEKNLPITSVDSDGFIEQFVYDADGKLISKRDKNGKIIPIRKIGLKK